MCDPGDEIILLAPYYFSHYNALTACGVTPVIVKCDVATLLPASVSCVKDAVSPRTKAVVLVSPGNPSGVVAPREFVDALTSLCETSGIWLVADEAYKEITYDGVVACAPTALAGVIRIYTMSKVYGLAGWRVGALVYPRALSLHLRKVQDTIPTHATIISQVVALSAIEEDSSRIGRRVGDFAAIRECFVRHITEVYEGRRHLHFVRGNGAFYLFLPVGCSTLHRSTPGCAADVVSFLVHTAKVLVVPGSAFGMDNYVRVSFGSVTLRHAESAAKALKAGLLAWFARQTEGNCCGGCSAACQRSR